MKNMIITMANTSTIETWKPWASLVFMVLIVVVMYFLFIRPQSKKDKAVAKMRSELQVGDNITTTGGIIGRVVSIKEETVVIETGSDRTKIKLLKSSIASNETIHD